MIHYPKNRTAQQELAKMVAVVHAQTVIEKIKAMPYPLEQKIQLIDSMKEYISQKDPDGG